MIFIKKQLSFTISFFIAFILFAITFLTILFFPFINNKNSKTAPDPLYENTIHNFRTIAIFIDDTHLFGSTVTINPATLEVTTNEINLHKNSNNKNYLEIFDNEGLFPLVSAVKSTIPDSNEYNFVIFNTENFSKIADIIGGLVYNEGDGQLRLLTAIQAIEIMSSRLFNDFCCQAAEKLLYLGSTKAYYTIQNFCPNDICYPDIYTTFLERTAQ